jgi:hypothetical protein
VNVEAVDTSRMAGGNSPESDISVLPNVGAEYKSCLHEYGLGWGLSKPLAAEKQWGCLVPASMEFDLLTWIGVHRASTMGRWDFNKDCEGSLSMVGFHP